jgi:hypothetical protein
VSRAGPYSLLLAAAVALLLAGQPGLLSGVDRVFELGVLTRERAGPLVRVLLLTGSATLLLGLWWLVRVHGAEARRAAYRRAFATLAQRIGGEVSSSGDRLRCWLEEGPVGRFQVDLTLDTAPGLRLLVAAPAVSALLVRRRDGHRGDLGWEPVAQGAGWELRAAGQDRVRRVGEDPSLAEALDDLFGSPASRSVRHDHLGVAVDLREVAPDELVPSVERAYAVAVRLADLNS